MKLKISLLIIFLSAGFSLLTAQSISLINNPNPGDYGFKNNNPFTLLNGKLYGLYSVNNYNTQLAEFNGTTTTLIPNPGALDQGISSPPISFANNLYCTYGNSNSTYQLAKYNGNNISLIPNLNTTDFGMRNEKIVFQNNLYTTYQNAGFKSQLVKFDGSNLTFIPNLNANDGGVAGSFLELNNKLYFIYSNAGNKGQLASYDGNTITVYPNPNTLDPGVNDLFLYNGSIYFRYQNSIYQNNLGTFTGSGISIIANPTSSITGLVVGMKQFHAIYNGNLYFSYGNFIGGQNLGMYLAKFDGTSITLIPNPSLYGIVVSNTIYNNSLYFRYVNASGASVLAKFDGTSISFIPIPPGIEFIGDPFVYNNVLYANYRNASTGQYELGYLNGNSISTIPNPTAAFPSYGYKGNPVIYNAKLYFNYETGFVNDSKGGGGKGKTSVSSTNPWPDNNSQIGLLVLPCTPTTSSTNQSICASQLPYTWNGLTFNDAGTQSKTFTGGNAQGCDSTATLVLTVNQLTASDTSATVCNKFTWHDSTYKASTDAIWHTTNAAGCDSARTLHLTITSVTSTTTKTNATCNNTATGSITVNPTYGISPFTYRIGTTGSFVSTNVFNNLRAGKYTVSILDVNGCAGITSQVTITQPAAVAGSAATTNVNCNGGATGSITVTPPAGFAPYMYMLGSTGVFTSSNVFNNLPAGAYGVYLKNANGCIGSMVVTITQPTKVSGTSTKTDETCPNAKNGSVTVTGAGGTSPYTYRFGSTGSFTSTNTFTNLKAGNYRVYVNDSKGCSGFSILTTVGQTSASCLIAKSNEAKQQVISEVQQGLGVQVSPNPSNSYFTMRVKATTQEVIQVRVIDVNGRSLYTAKGLPDQPFRFGEAFASGTYLVEVRQGNKMKMVKAVKVK